MLLRLCYKFVSNLNLGMIFFPIFNKSKRSYLCQKRVVHLIAEICVFDF